MLSLHPAHLLSVVPPQLNIHFLYLRVGLQVVGYLVRGEDGNVIPRRLRLAEIRLGRREGITQRIGIKHRLDGRVVMGPVVGPPHIEEYRALRQQALHLLELFLVVFHHHPVTFAGRMIVSEPVHIHLIDSKKRGQPYQHRSAQPYPPHKLLPYPPQLPQQHPQRQEPHRTETERIGRHLRGHYRKESIHQQHERERRDTMTPFAATHQQQHESRQHHQQMHHTLGSEGGRFTCDIIFIVTIPNITVRDGGQIESLRLVMAFHLMEKMLMVELLLPLIILGVGMAGIDLPRKEYRQRNAHRRHHLADFPLPEPEPVFRHGIDAPCGIHDQAHQPLGENGASREQSEPQYPAPFPATAQILHPRPQGGGNIKDETDIVVVHCPMT